MLTAPASIGQDSKAAQRRRRIRTGAHMIAVDLLAARGADVEFPDQDEAAATPARA